MTDRVRRAARPVPVLSFPFRRREAGRKPGQGFTRYYRLNIPFTRERVERIENGEQGVYIDLGLEGVTITASRASDSGLHLRLPAADEKSVRRPLRVEGFRNGQGYMFVRVATADDHDEVRVGMDGLYECLRLYWAGPDTQRARFQEFIEVAPGWALDVLTRGFCFEGREKPLHVLSARITPADLLPAFDHVKREVREAALKAIGHQHPGPRMRS